MSVKQISIFVENKTGLLSEVTGVLAQNNVNLRALSIADTPKYGILRIIVEDTQAAVKILLDNGYTHTVTDVLAVLIPDVPGGLDSVLKQLAAAGIAIEYTYAFLSQVQGKAGLIFRVEDNAAAEKALAAGGLQIAEAKELF